MKEFFSLQSIRSESGAVLRFQIAALIFCFCLPLVTRGIIIPLGLFIGAWLLLPNKSLHKKWIPVLVFSSIYILHLIGMFYTDNVPRGFKDLEQKLSLIVFPFLVGSTPKESLPARNDLLSVFVIGLIVSIALSFADSFVKYSDSGLITDFYMSAFSFAHHPSYFAMYINLGLAALLLFLLHFDSIRKKELIAGFISSLLIVGLVFSASKMGFIQFAFLIFFSFSFLVVSRQWKIRKAAFLITISVIFGVLLILNPVASNRVSSTIEVVGNEKAAEKAPEVESTVARITTWKLTLDAIKQHPLGVGTGDIQDFLDEVYINEGYNLLAEKGLNPHNNFLQVGLALGLPALFIFLFSLAFPILKIRRERDWLYAFFLVSMVFHLMVESMFEKQSGVMFFAFFNAFFYFSSGTEPKDLEAP